MTAQTHEQIQEELNRQVVANLNGRDVTRGELKTAFERVQPKTHWKDPINATVDLDAWTMALVSEAVVFFTGSVPHFKRLGGTTTGGIGRYHVTAAGYFNAVGA
jgi:hypothetical protein